MSGRPVDLALLHGPLAAATSTLAPLRSAVGALVADLGRATPTGLATAC